MELVRKVVNGTDLKDIVDIPNNLINKQVEILVFSIEEKENKNLTQLSNPRLQLGSPEPCCIHNKKKRKKSLSGFLSKYANPDLIEKEENVWEEEAKE